MSQKCRLFFLIVTLSLLPAAVPAEAITITWDGSAGDGSWFTASNWDQNRLPAPGDHVAIPNLANTSAVTFDKGSTASILSLDCAELLNLVSGTLTIADASSVSNRLVLSGATVNGAGNLRIDAAFTWTSGTMAGSGVTTVTSGWTIGSNSGTPILTRVLENTGNCAWIGTGGLVINSPGAFRNMDDGVVDATMSSALVDGGGLFHNRTGALFRRSAGTGSLQFACPVLNNGTWHLSTGTIQFANTASSTANFTTVSGTTLISSGTTSFTSSLTVGGTLQVVFGSTTVGGPTFATFDGAVHLNGGSLTVWPSVTIPILMVAGGTLTVNGATEVSSTFLMTAGTISGSGVLSIEPGATASIAPPGLIVLGGTLQNEGICNLMTSGLAISGLLANRSGGVFDIQGDFLISGVGSFSNGGGALLVKTQGAGISTLNCGLTNDGTVRVTTGTLFANGSFGNFSAGLLDDGVFDVTGTFRYNGTDITILEAGIILNGPSSQIVKTAGVNALANLGNINTTGSLRLTNGRNLTLTPSLTMNGLVTVGSGPSILTVNNGYNQNSGTTRLEGGTIVSTKHVNIQNGTLTGAGTITAPFINDGIVAPGSSAGLITVNGNYNQTAGGSLRIEIGGIAFGYDKLVVSGTANLAGNLTVTLVNFSPSLGNAYEVLTGNDVNGTFTSDNLPLGSSMKCLQADYSDENLILRELNGVTITAQPQDIVACPGGTVAFSVGVSGNPSGYQWRRNGLSLVGQTSSSLTLSAVVAAQANYDVVVAGPCGSVTSQAASLTVHCADTLYVKATAPPGGNGQSWATAFNSLQVALAAADVGEFRDIWVAQGTYKPAVSDRAVSFGLISKVALYGGFQGAESSRSQRKPDVFPTILSGDLAGNDGPNFTNTQENSAHVVRGDGADSTAMLDGFHIQAGAATLAGDGSTGGGIGIFSSGRPTVIDCVVSANRATTNGGGIAIGTNASARLFDCRFMGNKAGTGGALHISATTGSSVIDGCTFEDNSALSGGAVLVGSSAMAMRNCLFIDNEANNGVSPVGGAVSLVNNGTHVTFEDCIFTANSVVVTASPSAIPRGGAIALSTGSLATATRCLFLGNSVTATSGAIMGGAVGAVSASVTLRDCRFFSNFIAAGGNANGGALGYSGSAGGPVTQCVFSGNSATANGGAIEVNGNGPTTVTNCTLSGNSADVAGGGIRVSSSVAALTVNNSILWGNLAGGVANEAAQIAKVQIAPAPVVNRCNIEGLTGGLGGTGNIGLDPRFADADGDDDDTGTPDDFLHLLPASPSIDAGDNGLVPGGVTTDLGSSPRFRNDACKGDTGAGVAPLVDMGAYEFQSSCGLVSDVGDPPPGNAVARLVVGLPVPNPFEARTRLSFELPVPGVVRVEVFDLSGRLVRRLLETTFDSGEQTVEWNGLDETGGRVASGLYFVRVVAGGESATRKIVVR